jgi:hypothetical protein
VTLTAPLKQKALHHSNRLPGRSSPIADVHRHFEAESNVLEGRDLPGHLDVLRSGRLAVSGLPPLLAAARLMPAMTIDHAFSINDSYFNGLGSKGSSSLD